MKTEDKVVGRVSYSQYSMWMNCPLQWKLAYVDKVKPEEASIHLVFGTAMHEVIQYWITEAYKSNIQKANRIDLDEKFKATLIREFKKSIIEIPTTENEKPVKVFPCDKAILEEFYADGIAILKYLRDHAKKFFDTENWELVGVEVPLNVRLRKGVNYIGYLDVVLKERTTGDVYILDLKTSTKGWNKWIKADEKKLNQLLLYKHYYSEQLGISQDKIFVEFIILKRKLYEDVEFPQHRIVTFEPSHGKISVGRAHQSFIKFIDECFDLDGKKSIDKIIATPSKSACMFCPFNNNKALCSVSYYLGKKK
jgi:hypothetical protein